MNSKIFSAHDEIHQQDSPFTFLLFYGRINKVVDEFHHTIGMRL
ncbi:hypothetical protein [[Ruminococcus] lactaris]|nr:hypothetical protein [[Ruminococcus] lactaris]